MEFLSSILVGRPFNIAVVAAVFGIAFLVAQRSEMFADRNPRALLVVAAAWAVYGLWELAVVRFTPEANIRVDLLLIWPALLVLTVWFTIRAFR